MAEIIHDGFGWVKNSGTAALYTPKWDEAVVSGADTPAIGARFTGAGYISLRNNTQYLTKVFPGNREHVFVGFSYTALAATARVLFVLYDGTTAQVTVWMQADMSIAIVRGAPSGGTTVATSAPNLVSNPSTVWDYLEFEMDIHNTAGVFNVWKNNVSKFTASSLNLRSSANNFANKFRLSTIESINNNQQSFSDLYVIDDQAGNGPTTRVGDSRMITLVPTGAGSVTQWTPSTGANWQNVDDAPANEDTDYNSDGTVGHQDRFAMADLPGTVTGSIISVTHGYRARKDDAGVRSIVGNVRHSGTDAVGATNALTTGYQSFADTIWTDPSGGGALSVAVVNALEAGPDVIA